MRIALVRRGYSPTGGAEHYLHRLAGGLADHGHEPMLITASDWPDADWNHGVIQRVAGNSPLAFANALEAKRAHLECDKLLSLERVWSCDVYRAGDGVHAAWLERRAKFEPFWKSAFRRWQSKHRAILQLETALFNGGANKIIVNSRMVAEEIHTHFQTPSDKLHLIYNGFDKPEEETHTKQDPQPNPRSTFGIPQEAILLLFTGSGWERKGLRHAVEAVKILNNTSLHLLVAGSGKMHAQFRHPNIHFQGPVSDITPFLTTADIFLLPTIYDPFSNACLEAAHFGLPVITTNANGFNEIIEPGVTGTIVQTGDPQAIATAISEWMENKKCRTARATCADRAAPYTVASNVEKTIQLLIGK